MCVCALLCIYMYIHVCEAIKNNRSGTVRCIFTPHLLAWSFQTHTHLHIDICTHVSTHIWAYTYMYIDTHAHITHAHTSTHTCTDSSVHTHTHTHTHIHKLQFHKWSNQVPSSIATGSRTPQKIEIHYLVYYTFTVGVTVDYYQSSVVLYIHVPGQQGWSRMPIGAGVDYYQITIRLLQYYNCSWQGVGQNAPHRNRGRITIRLLQITIRLQQITVVQYTCSQQGVVPLMCIGIAVLLVVIGAIGSATVSTADRRLWRHCTHTTHT